MTLAINGTPDRVEFAFPGRCCDVRFLELRRVGAGQDPAVLWRIEATDAGAQLPFPAVLGEAPDGYRSTVTLDESAFRRAAENDDELEIDASVGSTNIFRLSELSATGRVVQVQGSGSRSVSRFTSMTDYRADYLRDQSKELRGNRRALVAWLVAAAVATAIVVVLLVRRSRRRAGAAR